MKKALLAGAAIDVRFAGMAFADITIADLGPDDGPIRRLRRADEGGRRAGGRRHQCRRRRAGPAARARVGDDACDPKQAVAVANQMAGKGVSLIAGHFCSGSSIPASAVYADDGIIQISPASTNPQVHRRAPWPGASCRVCGRDDQQGKVAGAFLAKKFKDKNIAIIHDKTAYGKGLADETRKYHERGGQDAMLYESYNAGEKDYSALVSKLKAANIDVLYVGGYHTEAGLIIRQMVDQGMKHRPRLRRRAGHRRVLADHRRCRRRHADDLLARSAQEPDRQAGGRRARGRRARRRGLLALHLRRHPGLGRSGNASGTTDFEPVVAALAAGSFDTVLGDVKFDAKGDVALPGYVFYEWKNGKYPRDVNIILGYGFATPAPRGVGVFR